MKFSDALKKVYFLSFELMYLALSWQLSLQFIFYSLFILSLFYLFCLFYLYYLL